MRVLLPLLCALQGILYIGCATDTTESTEDELRAQPVAVRITVESAVKVEAARAFQFHADVSNTTYPTCTWSVNGVIGGNEVLGTVTNEGLYTAPSVVPDPNLVTISATATADVTKSASVTVIIQPRPVVTRPLNSELILPVSSRANHIVTTSMSERFSLPARPLRKAPNPLVAVCKERI